MQRLIMGLLFLSACSSSITPTVAPSGKTGYILYCPGLGKGADCITMAGRSCPLGYTVLDRSTTQLWVECRERPVEDTSCSQPSVKTPGF